MNHKHVSKQKIGGRAAPLERRKVYLIVDIQSRMIVGKGPAYERWAKAFNLKQMAVVLHYLQENCLMEYLKGPRAYRPLSYAFWQHKIHRSRYVCQCGAKGGGGGLC